MALSRPTPPQISTDLSLDAAREATWKGFVEAGVNAPIIDREKNIVAGTTGDGFLTATRTVNATFASQNNGTVITVASKAALGGAIDFGIGKRRAKKVADSIEGVIVRGWTSPPAVAASDAPQIAPVAPGAPIADPTTTPKMSALAGGPVYGVAMPAKQGNTLMVYAILGLTCVPIAAPFALFYAGKALKNYGELDPGDKSLVKVCRILGIIGCVLLVPRMLLQIWLLSGSH